MWSGTLNWVKVYHPPTRKCHSCSFLQQVYPHPQGDAQWPGLGLFLVQGSGVGPLCSPGGSLTDPSPQEAPGPCYSNFAEEITLGKKIKSQKYTITIWPYFLFYENKYKI